MSYDQVKRQWAKEKIDIVELDLEYCGNTFGQAPCTASGSGDAKCVNTRNKCQDLPNFTATTKTYRHCTNRSPHPSGIDAIPDLESVNVAPSRIDLSGGLGVRATVDLRFSDHPGSDIDIDKYLDERTTPGLDRSTYWKKLRARNPGYQNRELRVLSGYLVNGVYDPINFETRHYIIDALDVSGGTARIKGKDPLKLAANKKALAPNPSTGKLLNAITSGATSLTLTPSGAGDEYPTSGKVLIRNEVISYSGKSGDQLTGLTRGQNNTIADAHSENDTVQLCLEYSAELVNDIVYDLITNYANVPPTYINKVAWESEDTTYLNGLLSGIVCKPTDVNKLLKELSQSSPHYLWWNEKAQAVEFTALKEPGGNAPVLNMDANIIKDSFSTADKPELRKNTVFVNYGQFNPTKKLDEPDNFQQTYARVDKDSIAKYDSSQVEEIFTRWIPVEAEASARRLAALIGRRFADIPREINFSLEAKDSDVWTGQTWNVNHRDIVDDNGSPVDTAFQIISAAERNNFDYKALEFVYGGSLPEDEGGGEPGVNLVFIPANATNVNFRALYDAQYPAPNASTVAKVILDASRICGSESNALFSMDTGSWPAGATVTLQLNPDSIAAGIGGAGATSSGFAATAGGPCLILNHDLELINNGVLGGGGGGGGRQIQSTSGGTAASAGGGGAGYLNGITGGGNTIPAGATGVTNIPAQSGSELSGGAGGFLTGSVGGDFFFTQGGKGGDLGQAGESKSGGGGSAGVAIDRNGFTLTQTVAGDIRGSIIN